jgi:hypothetical protein
LRILIDETSPKGGELPENGISVLTQDTHMWETLHFEGCSSAAQVTSLAGTRTSWGASSFVSSDYIADIAVAFLLNCRAAVGRTPAETVTRSSAS